MLVRVARRHDTAFCQICPAAIISLCSVHSLTQVRSWQHKIEHCHIVLEAESTWRRKALLMYPATMLLPYNGL